MSTKGRYAARIMVRLALSYGDAPVSKQLVADAEGVTVDYVEQIMIMLRTAGLVKSHRGSRGGFTLGKPPEEITVAEVLQASEGPLAIVPCSSDDCGRSTACVTRELWRRAEAAMMNVFEGCTVAELAANAKENQ